jgi:predicted DNA-binding transcriptional regulator AlpA
VKLLRIDEVSKMTGVPEATLRYWRHTGNRGPKSANLEGRRVVYREQDVVAWVDAQFEAAGSSEVVETRKQIAEQIAVAIEKDAQFEGPRAARIIAMCAATARRLGAEGTEGK